VTPVLHSFEGSNARFGLYFADETEADVFGASVLERIRKRQSRQEKLLKVTAESGNKKRASLSSLSSNSRNRFDKTVAAEVYIFKVPSLFYNSWFP
jgi:hypothetical protein